MRIRSARLDDAPALASLMTELGYPSTLAEVERRLPALLGSPEHRAFVVDEGDAPVGFAHAALKRTLQADPLVEIVALVVRSGSRGVGAGAALVAHAEAWAREQGVGRVVVRSNVTRERTHRFYLREGYTLGKTSHRFEKRF